MEEIRKTEMDKRDQEIVYSKAIKAGKRIYYLDVKKNRKDELFLAITESKKKVNGEDAQVSFEKHKIFLYKEDFEKFQDGINEVINFINQSGGTDSAGIKKEEAAENSTVAGKEDSNNFEVDFS